MEKPNQKTIVVPFNADMTENKPRGVLIHNQDEGSRGMKKNEFEIFWGDLTEKSPDT